MKKLIQLALPGMIVLIAIILAGCASNSGQDASATTKAAVATTSQQVTTTEPEAEETSDEKSDDNDETSGEGKYVIEGVEYETGENLPWPSEHTDNLPKLQANIVATVIDSNTNVIVITYQDVKEDEVKKYVEAIKDQGYKPVLEMSMEGSYTFSGEHQDGPTILVMHADDETGVITYDPDPES